MTLVERFRTLEGSHGRYEWVVEVWRSDTIAVANLRVRTRIHRATEQSFAGLDWTTRSEVYTETRTSSKDTVDEDVEAEREKARKISKRFEAERLAAESAGGGA